MIGLLPPNCQLYARFSVSKTDYNMHQGEVQARVREHLTKQLAEVIVGSKLHKQNTDFDVSFGMDLIVMDRADFTKIIQELQLTGPYGRGPLII